MTATRKTPYERWLHKYNQWSWCLASGGDVERYMRAAFNAGRRFQKRRKKRLAG